MREHLVPAQCARLRARAESDIMEMCGWKTRAMFQRYAIRDEKGLGRSAPPGHLRGRVRPNFGPCGNLRAREALRLKRLSG